MICTYHTHLVFLKVLCLTYEHAMCISLYYNQYATGYLILGLQVVDNVLKILTIELMVALQALHVRKGKNSHFRVPPLVERLFQECIALTPPSSHDRHRAKDFDVLHAFIRDKLATNADFVSSGNKPKS